MPIPKGTEPNNFALALYGALVASYAAVVSTWVARTNRGRLRLDLAIVIRVVDPYMTDRDGTGIDQQARLRLDITNIGTRPIRADHWGLTVGHGPQKGEHESVPHELPKTLGEAEASTEWAEDLSLLTSELTSVWVEDGKHRRWKASRKLVRRVIEDRKSYVQLPEGWFLAPAGRKEG